MMVIRPPYDLILLRHRGSEKTPGTFSTPSYIVRFLHIGDGVLHHRRRNLLDWMRGDGSGHWRRGADVRLQDATPVSQPMHSNEKLSRQPRIFVARRLERLAGLQW